MVHICVGRECNDYMECDKKNICKYSRNKRFPMSIFNLFLLYKRHNRLSGTSKCPYHKSRNYTCWDCAHQTSLEECDVTSKDRLPYIEQDGWTNYSRCGSFKKASYANDYLYEEYKY